MFKRKIYACVAFWFCSQVSHAQFNVEGQVIQRGEYRHGFNKLIKEGDDPAVFIAQRARLQASYKLDKLNFFMSVQDIRTWGSTPQIKETDAFLSVHEAWAETQFSDKWSAKLGRQELNYDNARFLGNLDWALQARAHDFALVKYENGNRKLHIGAGYNQEKQQLSGSLFGLNSQYKTAQMLRYENKSDSSSWHYALLLWNDGRQFMVKDTAGQVIRKDVFYRVTLGVPTLKYKIGKTLLSGFYYHQLGKDANGKEMQAFNASLQANYEAFSTEEGKKLNLVTGTEIISGTPSDNKSINRSFSPLYGTNHAFNGYMDLFYVGGSFENNVGLSDYYLKSRYTANPKLFVQIDGHYFTTAAKAVSKGETLSADLGTEIDLTLGYVLTPSVSLQAGYSHYFQSDTYKTLTNVTKADAVQNWAYVMLVYRPTSKNKFIGILL